MKQMYEQHPFLPHIVWRAVSSSAAGWEHSASLSVFSFLRSLLAWPQFVAFLLRFAIFKEDRFGFCFWPRTSLLGMTWGLPCRQRLSFSMSVWSVLPAPIYRARKFLRFPGIHHYPFPRVSTDQGQSVSEQFVSGRVPENNSKEISHRYEIGPLDQVISYL